jgi:hypothetical protein
MAAGMHGMRSSTAAVASEQQNETETLGIGIRGTVGMLQIGVETADGGIQMTRQQRQQAGEVVEGVLIVRGSGRMNQVAAAGASSEAVAQAAAGACRTLQQQQQVMMRMMMVGCMTSCLVKVTVTVQVK